MMKTIKELKATKMLGISYGAGYHDGYFNALKDILELIDEVVIVPSIKKELKARIEG